MSELHPRARDLLARAAHGHDPTDDDRTRNRAAIASRLVVGGAVATAAIATAKSAAASAGAAAPSVAPPAIGLAGAGASGGGVGAGVAGAGAAGLGVAGVAGTAGTAGVAASSGLGASLLVKVMASIVVAGSVGVGAVEVHRARQAPPTHVEVAPPPAAPPSPLDSHVASPRSGAPSLPAAPAATEEAVNPTPSVAVGDLPRAPLAADAPRRAPSAQRAATTTVAAPTPENSVQAEAALLGRAQEQLNSGRGADALALLDEHARRYPHGALSEERDAARVITLCSLGRKAQAAREADAFVAAYPRSPQLARVRGACPP